MRIIAGRLRGRRLQAPPGQDTRPTSDLARGALFDALGHDRPRLVGARFLDVFAGCGAVGLEAYSRGAREVLLIENARPALEAIRANLARLPVGNAVRVLARDASDPGRAERPFDIAFLDPPYRSGLAAAALLTPSSGGWLVAEARVVVELARTEDPPELADFVIERVRRYGAAKFVFLRYRPHTGPPEMPKV